MEAETKESPFLQELTRSFGEIKRSTAISVAEDIELIYKYESEKIIRECAKVI